METFRDYMFNVSKNLALLSILLLHLSALAFSSSNLANTKVPIIANPYTINNSLSFSNTIIPKNGTYLSELSISGFSINEAAGTATFNVSLNTDEVGLGAFTLDYQITNGSANAGDDYTAATPGTLNFNGTNGETQTITVTLINDTVFEGNETLIATISNVSNPIVSIIDADATGTILDDDAPNRSIFISDFSVSEAAGTGNFLLTYTGPTINNAFTIDFVINDGSAVSPDDYSLASPSPVIFPAGTTGGDTQVITINIVDDAVIESAESMTAILTNISTNSISIVDGLGSGRIIDNDEPDPNQGISALDFTVNESAGTTTFRVRLNVDVSESFTVMYNISDGSANSGLDYNATMFGTLSFAGTNGEVQTVTVNIIDDAIIESIEFLSISLFNLSTNQIYIVDGNAIGTINDNDAPNTNDGVSVSDFSVNEAAGTANFFVTLNTDVPGGFSLDYNISDGSATSISDYNALLAGTLNFAGLNGETVPVTISIIDDVFLEGAEFLSIALSNLTTASIYIVDGNAFGTITDNDQPSPGQGISVIGFSVNEAVGITEFSVVYTGPDVEDEFNVDYVINNVSANNPSDYNAISPGLVTFPSGTQDGETQIISVNIIDDNIIENTENLAVSLTAISQNAITIVTPTELGFIIDNDSTGPGEGISASDFTVNEAIGTTDFVITYTGPTVQNSFNVNFNVNAGSATEPQDYTVATSGNSITFPAGTASGDTRVVTINIIEDTIIEQAEDLNIILSNVSNSSIGLLDATGIGTITDNDSDPSFGISVTGFTVNEATGTATFNITLNRDVQGGFSVDYLVSDGTANAPSDYNASSPGSINFAGTSGEVQSVTISIIDDNTIESTENLNITLSNISNTLVAIIDGNAIGTITDNDSNPGSGVSVADFTVNEDAGTATFNVSLSVGVQGGFSVDYIIADGTAISPDDYNSSTSGTLNFTGTVGEIQSVTINIIDDSIIEAAETLNIILSNISNTLVLIVDGDATGTITDNDVNATSGISALDFTVTEAVGSTNFDIVLNSAVQGGFSVDYTITDGTAISPNDYNSTTSGTLNFAGTNGETQSVSVTIIDDLLLENSENLSITLSNISNTLVTIVDANGIGTITDNDALGVGDGISVADFNVNEAVGTVDYIITYTGPTIQNSFTVDYLVSDGSANTISDYTTSSPGTFTFPAGTTSGTTQSVTITIIDDSLIEPSENLNITLSNISNGLVLMVDGDAVGIITDNDSNAASGISVADFTVNEAAGTAIFNINLNSEVQGGFSVNYSISDGTANSGNDYNAVPTGTINFVGTNGEIQTVTVTIIDDNIIEASENLSIALSNISNTLVSIIDGNAIGTINDNDAIAGTGISFDNDNITVDEAAGAATVNVLLTGNFPGGFTLDYTSTDASAVAPGDYTTNSGQLTFAGTDGETQPITISIIDDNLIEALENLLVDLSNLSTGLISINDNQATVNITDNENDNDNDGVADQIDLDDDNDGILDINECEAIDSGLDGSLPFSTNITSNNPTDHTEQHILNSITHNGITYSDFIYPNSFTSSFAVGNENEISYWINGGSQFYYDTNPNFDADVAVELQNNNLNSHLYLGSGNNYFDGDFFDLAYNTPFVSSNGGFIAVTERGGNNSQIIQALDYNGNPIGTQITVLATDYTSLAHSVNSGSNPNIFMAIYPVDDLVSPGTEIHGLRFTFGSDSTNDGPDAKVFLFGDISSFGCDADGDGLVNTLDPDSDNDGCFDTVEAGHTDGDNDGVLGSSPVTVDAQGRVTGQGGYTGASGNEIIATQITINTDPSNQTVNEGNSTSFTIDAEAMNTANFSSGNPVYSGVGSSDSTLDIQYQWQENGTNLANGGVYSGVNSGTLNISDVTGLNGNTYTVLLTHSNNNCYAENRSATLATLNPCDPVSSGNVDTDGDGVSDICDEDDDNDGILDINEGFAAPLELISNGDFSSGLTSWTVNNPTGDSAPIVGVSGAVEFGFQTAGATNTVSVDPNDLANDAGVTTQNGSIGTGAFANPSQYHFNGTGDMYVAVNPDAGGADVGNFNTIDISFGIDWGIKAYALSFGELGTLAPGNFDIGTSNGLVIGYENATGNNLFIWNGVELARSRYYRVPIGGTSMTLSINSTGLISLFAAGRGPAITAQIPGTEWQDTNNSNWQFIASQTHAPNSNPNDRISGILFNGSATETINNIGDSIEQNITTSINDTATVSYEISTEGTGSANFNVLTEILDDTGAVIASNTSLVSSGTNAVNFNFAPTSTNASIRVTLLSASGDLSTRQLLVDNISITQGVAIDTDNDGIFNHLDSDSDNDGCVDAIEAGHTDSDSDGYLGNSPVVVDSEGRVTGQGGYTGATGNEIVATEVTLNSLPTDQTSDNGDSASFTIDVSAVNTTSFSSGNPDYGSGTDSSSQLQFQWQESGTNLSNGGVYSGVNTNTLSISNVTGLDSNTYTVLVTHLDNVCFSTSQGANLDVSPDITIDDSSTAEGTNNVFTVTASHAINQDIVFNINYANITTANTDYNGLTTVTLLANSTSASFNVAAVDDALIEPTETHETTISYVSGPIVNITDGTGLGTITDNDGGVGNGITFDNTNVIVDEDAGTATFTVRLTGNVAGGFTLDYASADDSAIQILDYSAVSGTLTFLGNNDESFDIIVPITDDNVHELTQSFNLNLSNLSTTLVPIIDPTATGTINDDDNASVFAKFVAVFESDLVYNLEVELNAAVEHSFTVDFETFGNENVGLGGTATLGADYATNVNTTFTFPANSPAGTIVSIPITVIQDAIVEPSETIVQVVDNISDPSIGILSPNRTFTIQDDDGGPGVGISVSDFTVNEDAGTTTFDVLLNTNVSEGFTVDFDISDGSAISPNDYSVAAVTGQLTFAGTNGEVQSVTVTIVDDAITEFSETLAITISNLSSTLINIMDADGIGTITDNEMPGANDGISVADFTVNENVGTVDFVVTYTGPTVADVFTVDFAVADGSAISPDDYIVAAATGNVSFPANTATGTTQTVTVTILDDTLLEGPEDLNITLSNITNVLVAMVDADGIGTITDNDGGGAGDGISVADFTVNENVGTVDFVVTYTGPTVADAFTVDFAVVDGTAISPDDYTVAAATGNVSFPANTATGTTQTVTVTILDDTLLETSEDLNITLSNISNVLIAMLDADGVGTITDNEMPGANDGISVADFTVNENVGAVDFVITYTGPTVADAFTVDFAVVDATAISPDDYTVAVAIGNVSFPANTTTGTTQTVTVTIINDALIESAEELNITLSNISNASIALVDGDGIGVINDDDIDLDADDDGILDSFEDLNADGDNDPATNPTNSDNDAYPDYLDIDSDDDGIPDNVEAQTTSGYIPPSLIDANGNGVDDAYETGTEIGIIPVNTDGEDLPDYLDDDSDNDNVPDNIEAHDYNQDGVADVVLIGSDKDNDGLDDSFEGIEQIDIDINDEIDDPINDLPNTDGDDESDYRDLDDDGDGIPTIEEDVNEDMDYSNDDWDNDGIPDYLDPDQEEEIDAVEIFNVVTPNNDMVHDFLMITGLELRPDNNLKIYNRWGILVYSTASYNTEGNVFDGTSQARVTIGKDDRLPVGTYFYLFDYVEVTGERVNLSGYLYLN